MSDHPFRGEVSPSVQPKPPLVQLKTMSSRPAAEQKKEPASYVHPACVDATRVQMLMACTHALVTPHVGYCAQIFLLLSTRATKVPEGNDDDDFRGWNISLMEERLRNWASLAWRRLRGNLINVYKYLNGGVKRMVVLSDRMRGNILEYRKFHLNMGKNFSTVKVTEHWNRLLRLAMESPSLEIFKIHLDTILN
ncbi:hypothetical protein BTVI_73424 [Pitangus sulphuratus]|nr:hypothetical protein BTVI_73424 [Pitangus sulphuratus]